MSWTTPLTWTDGLLVAASTLNQQLRDNLRYLKGQLGAIFLENAIELAEVAEPPNPPSGRVSVWNTNTPFRQMLYAKFNDGTRRRLAHYAVKLRRTSTFNLSTTYSHVTIPLPEVEFSSHPNVPMSDGTGFVAPEAGIYFASANFNVGDPTSFILLSIAHNSAIVAQSSAGYTGQNFYHSRPSTSTIVWMNAGDILRIYIYSFTSVTTTHSEIHPSLSVFSL